jgi:hypothetical protein
MSDISNDEHAATVGAHTVPPRRGFDWSHVLVEIGTVVVGILIALAVNNWAQAQRDHAVETHYLERLLADSRENLAMIQERIDLHTRRADTLAGLIKWLKNGTPRPTDAEVSEVLCRWFIQPALRLRRETYAELVSSGNLALLRDVQVRSLLEQAETRHEEWLRLDRFADTIMQRVTAPLDRYREWQIDPNSIGNVGCHFDFQGMLSDPAMPSMLAQIYRDETLNRRFRQQELDAVRAAHDRILLVRSKP